eukprot:4107863-Pyramimonas_sp.AAC.1
MSPKSCFAPSWRNPVPFSRGFKRPLLRCSDGPSDDDCDPSSGPRATPRACKEGVGTTSQSNATCMPRRRCHARSRANVCPCLTWGLRVPHVAVCICRAMLPSALRFRVPPLFCPAPLPPPWPGAQARPATLPQARVASMR